MGPGGGNDPESEPSGDGALQQHERGRNTATFVAWDAVATSPLNLPVREMDVYLAG